MKRLIDIVVSSVLLVLFFPLIVVLALAVKVTSPGPAFFGQVRVGRRGRPFTILKLRSMVSYAEEMLSGDATLFEAYMANHFKLPVGADPRLTRFGRIMRRTSLDELPQLLNVILGQMSLVGPRPVLPDELLIYRDAQFLYLGVRPGITGYWQVHGRSDILGADRVELDLYYLQRPSVWLDLQILVKTVPAVLRCRGAH